MSESLFGTDGVRGQVGVEPITPFTILKLGWAIGKVLRESGRGDNVLIGKDTRVSGYLLESALEAGLCAAGMNITLLGPIPTPGIAYLTRSARASAGVVISGSHNSYQDNGIKIFSSDGSKLNDKYAQAIDDMMHMVPDCVPSRDLGRARRFPDAQGRYIEYCKSTFDSMETLEKLSLVLDCANGAAYDIAPRVLTELGANLTAIGINPDGYNINEGCGSTNLTALKAKVQDVGADMGIALDGDADRVILVDSQGATYNGDHILYILSQYRHRRGILNGGVVGTMMTNIGLELALKRDEIPFIRTRVGDRYVHESLISKSWALGGEASGHIICLDKSTTGDGIVAALEVMEVMLKTGKNLGQLCAGMELYPQYMVNIPIKVNKGKEIIRHERVQDVVKYSEKVLGSRGRVVLRPSGTESVFRVMLEGADFEQIKILTEQIAEVVKKAAAM